jgi:hypothetical protein
MNLQIKEATKILKQNTKKELNLYNWGNNLYFLLLFLGIRDEDATGLSECLKSNSSLKKLDLDCTSNQNF